MAHPLHAYFARIGRKGGLKSRRALEPRQARAMVAVRLARKAFRDFRIQCFWSYRDRRISPADVGWVVAQLRRNGDLRAWRVAARIQALLCP